MRILFLQDSGINESLALADLSGALGAQGHERCLIFGDEERHLDQRIREYDPQLVVIPCPVAGHKRALADAARAKAATDCTTLLAGTYATFNPDLARRPEVDAVCVGEAEGAVAELAEALHQGKGVPRDIANLAVDGPGGLVVNPVRPAIEDLDSLPFPDRDLAFSYDFMARLPWKKFSTGRGCVHTCSFCWNTTVNEMYGGASVFVRRKSPQRAVEEVRRVMRRYPLTRVHFSDDLFTLQAGWLERFAPLYRQAVGLPFTCNSSVPLTTERAVAALASAGCSGVAIGVETGNEDLRAEILGKRVSNDQVRAAAAVVKGHGLKLITFNMVGSPGETVDDVLSTIALNRELGADYVRVNIAVPLPHTSFEDSAFTRGFLNDKWGAARLDGLTKPRLIVNSDERQALVNLYLAFRPAVHLSAVHRHLPSLVKLSTPRLLSLLRLWGVVEEKGITGIGWLDGLRYFRHVGEPRKRTANYVSLI
ncbi:MAG: radical SAM protein [Oligoflexia bacterium]|nr:radical SAM protein [Oligoflexia bacterium]